MLADKEIMQLVEGGVLINADPSRIGPVSYDLRSHGFYRDGEQSSTVTLAPGDSTFVGAKEGIALPNDMTCEVRLKNSRIRQGLTLDAPLYFPGHTTRVYFRVTNVTADEITLTTERDLAQVTFERLSTPSDAAYSGTFDEEFDFIGMGDYTDIYASEIRKLKKEAEKIERMEQRIYGNVVAIMGVFVAVFSLVDLNQSWLSGQVDVSNLIIVNLSVVGGMAALVGLVTSLLGSKGRRVLPWALAAVSFVTAILLTIISHP